MEKYTNGYRSIFVEKPPRLKCECVLLKQRGHTSESTLCAVLGLISCLPLALVHECVCAHMRACVCYIMRMDVSEEFTLNRVAK